MKNIKKWPHAKIMLVGGNYSPITMLFLKFLRIAFPDKILPHDNIHVFHNGDYIFNPFKISNFGYGIAHFSDFMIPTDNFISKYSLYRNTNISKIDTKQNLIIAEHNNKPYSYEILVNLAPQTEHFFEIPGAISALENQEIPVFAFNNLQNLQKMSNFINNFSINKTQKIVFYDNNENSKNTGIFLAESAIKLKKIFDKKFGKNKSYFECHFNKNTILNQYPEINERIMKILKTNNIQTKFNSKIQAINPGNFTFQNLKYNENKFNLLFLIGELKKPKWAENINNSNIFTIQENIHPRGFLINNELFNILLEISNLLKISINQADYIKENLQILNNFEISEKSWLNLDQNIENTGYFDNLKILYKQYKLLN